MVATGANASLRLGSGAALAAAVALSAAAAVAADPPQRVLSRDEACRLARQDATPEGRTYTIKGKYTWISVDGIELFEPDGCDAIFLPRLEGRASAKLDDYVQAFRRKCRASLGGDSIPGTFAGVFIRDEADTRENLGGQWVTIRQSHFVIADFESAKVDPSAIRCAH